MQDLAGAIKRIAAFVGLPLDDELLQITLKQSSAEHMAQHRSKYDEHPIKLMANEKGGLHRDAGLDGLNQVRFRHSMRTK